MLEVDRSAAQMPTSGVTLQGTIQGSKRLRDPGASAMFAELQLLGLQKMTWADREMA
jgi:hypothetical protein